MFPFQQFDFDGIPDNDISPNGFESGEGVKIPKQTQLHETEHWGDLGDINLFCSDLGFYQDNTTVDGQSFLDFGSLDDLYVDFDFPPFQSDQEEITKVVTIQSENSEFLEAQQEKPYSFPLESLGILKNYISRFRQLNGENINVPSYDPSCTRVSGRKLSTDAVIRLAGENFIQSCSQRFDDCSVLSHPYALTFFGFPNEETRDVALVQNLLASAEKVGDQQFDRASKLLNQCNGLSSDRGSAVQRLVYYFSEALREKIDRERGTITSKGLGKKQSFDVYEAMMSPNPSIIAIHQEVPFSQVIQFAGIQAIVENVVEAKKVHIIDLEIRSGMQFTVLMQALAARWECPLVQLKITAIGTKSKAKIEETGRRLMSFAQSMNITFCFNVIMVADMLDLNENLFELDDGEAVAVYSPYILSTVIAHPDRLECLMRVIKNINPRVMVVCEVEANHNSPVFMNRFVESLFFFGAFFESLEDCMDHDDRNRMIAESEFLSHGIWNIVATEGEERTIQHVRINSWREFFVGFGMVETELSMSSLYQATLVIKKFACGSSCTLSMDGKCLIIGWKGTPLFSLSTWKFL